MLRLLVLLGLGLLAKGQDELPPGCVPVGSDPEPLDLDASTPGLITSPGFNNTDEEATYPPDVRCDWRITMEDTSFEDLELRFFAFEIEPCVDCRCDAVSVYDGDEPNEENLIGRFCFNEIPDTITTQGRALYVVFESDDQVQFSGFLARYGYPFASDACSGGTVEELEQGIFMTPDYPLDYENNMFCEWHFNGTDGERIELSFINFDVENCCTCDRMSIFDGEDGTAPFKGFWFGTGRPARMTSSGSSLFMRFQTDISVTGPGYIGVYRRIPAGGRR